MVKDGEAHGMFPIGWNPERVKWLWFSPPLLKTAYGFFVHGDNPLQFRGEKDVRGYTVGVYGPSNTSRSLQEIKKKIGELTIDLRPGDEAGFRKLACKRIDGVYSNREVGHSLMAKLKLKNIRYAGTHKELKYYVGFSQQHTRKEIVNLFNTTIKMLHQQGAIRQILVKYHMETSFDSDQ